MPEMSEAASITPAAKPSRMSLARREKVRPNNTGSDHLSALLRRWRRPLDQDCAGRLGPACRSSRFHRFPPCRCRVLYRRPWSQHQGCAGLRFTTRRALRATLGEIMILAASSGPMPAGSPMASATMGRRRASCPSFPSLCRHRFQRGRAQPLAVRRKQPEVFNIEIHRNFFTRCKVSSISLFDRDALTAWKIAI